MGSPAPERLAPLFERLKPFKVKVADDIREEGWERRESSRIVQGSMLAIRRCVSLHGSRASVARTSSSDSASTACTTRCSSDSGR